MEVVITEWSLQCYLDLVKRAIFSRADYWNIVRPDVELLKDYDSKPSPKFGQAKFWGPATDRTGNVIPAGWKMKWHNLGPGSVQLRLTVALLGNDAYLCDAYVKDKAATDHRYCAKLKRRINLIKLGQYHYRGKL